MKPIARICLATLFALLLGRPAHAQTVAPCQLLLHPEGYNGHMIHVRGHLVQTPTSVGISDNYCTAPLDRGIQVSFRPVRNRNWYKFWYYKSFPSEYSGKNPPFYRISGTFYGLFRYHPSKNGHRYPQRTLILASVSHLSVKKVRLPIFISLPFTPPPYENFPVSPPPTCTTTPGTNLDRLLPMDPAPHIWT